LLAQYDSFGNFEIPQITLCNPDGRALGILSNLSDRKMNIRFNDLSDLSFTIRRGTEDCRCPVYEQVEPFRYLLVEGIGYFVITDVSESEEKNDAFKTVEASSCEYELNNIQLGYYEGTYKFYSADDSEPKQSLISDIMKRLPSWRLDTDGIPAAVAARSRTFDTTDQTVYAFLMTEMEEAYECLFEFDILNRIIRVYDRYQYDNRTDICLSTEDVLKGLTLRTKSDEIKTALTVKGGNKLDILSVNPLGTNMIYNFSYYLTNEWMDAALIAKVQKWQADVAAFAEEETGIFPQKRAQINAIQSRKADREGEITRLKQDLTNLQTQQSAIISEPAEQAQKNANLASVRTKINAAKSALSSAESALASIEAELKAANAELKALQDQISLNAVFTPAEMEVLSRFIQQGAYTEENITRQDNMSYEEVQAQALELYKKAQSLLNTISTPRYEYSVETGSFIFQKEFAHLTNQLHSGCLIDVRLAEDDIASLLLLEMAVDYDGRGLSLTFGNRYKLSDPSALFNDLVGGSVAKTASTVEYLRTTFDFKQQKDHLDQLQELKDEAINLTHNMVVNADNQVMVIDASGISGRRAVVDAEFNPTGEFDPEVLKITNNAIAFSTDDFQTTETVLGKNLLPDGVTTPDGKNYMYGLNAKLLMGDLIIGERLKVSGEIEGRLINAKGLTVNNGVTDTLRVDENGDVSLNVKSLSITGNQVATQGDVANGINGLQIGGRNLLLNTGYGDNLVNLNYWVCSKQNGTGSISIVADGIHGKVLKFTRGSDSTGWFYFANTSLNSKGFKFTVGQKYTLSFWALRYTDNTVLHLSFKDGNSTNQSMYVADVTLKQGWNKYEITATATAAGNTNSLYIAQDIPGKEFCMAKIKLELGTKATDWTPAPEDRAYLVNTLSPTQADGMWLGSDGKLNITATQIKAGKLQSKDGSSYFDLENGKIVGKNTEMTGNFTAKPLLVDAEIGAGTSATLSGFNASDSFYPAGMSFKNYYNQEFGRFYGSSFGGSASNNMRILSMDAYSCDNKKSAYLSVSAGTASDKTMLSASADNVSIGNYSSGTTEIMSYSFESRAALKTNTLQNNMFAGYEHWRAAEFPSAPSYAYKVKVGIGIYSGKPSIALELQDATGAIVTRADLPMGEKSWKFQ